MKRPDREVRTLALIRNLSRPIHPKVVRSFNSENLLSRDGHSVTSLATPEVSRGHDKRTRPRRVVVYGRNDP